MAAGQDAVAAIEGDCKDLTAMLDASADLKTLIAAGNRGVQGQAIGAVGRQAGFNRLTLNFLGVLAANGRLSGLAAILSAVQAELARRRGESKAVVETAFPLSDAQLADLRDQLGKSLQSTVTLDVTVNKELLGGMIVTIGSRQIDGSVRRKLELLKRAMSAAA